MLVRRVKLTWVGIGSRLYLARLGCNMKRSSTDLQRTTSNNIGRGSSRNPNQSAYSGNSRGSNSPGRMRASAQGQASSSHQPVRSRSSAPVDMSGELAQFVKEAVQQDQVVIFSKTYCPYCTMAKDVFKKMEKPFTVIELDKRNDGNTIQDILKEMTGARTVPRVFLNGECIGGGTDVQALYDNGTLQTMIVKKV